LYSEKRRQKRYTSTPFYSYSCSLGYVINDDATDAAGAIINDRGANTTSRGVEAYQRSITVGNSNEVTVEARE
jgi:hypothetical protein